MEQRQQERDAAERPSGAAAGEADAAAAGERLPGAGSGGDASSDSEQDQVRGAGCFVLSSSSGWAFLVADFSKEISSQPEWTQGERLHPFV